MLIDVTRRPVRLIYEECQTAVVIRTMAIRGKTDGLLRREKDKEKIKKEAIEFYDRNPRGKFEPIYTFQPMVTVPNNGADYIETILEHHIRDAYTVSGYADQISRTRGIWRLNFIIDTTPQGSQLLTLLDETHSTVLITIQLPIEISKDKVFNVTTPLQRYLNQNRIGGQAGLWGALTDEF